MRAYFLCALFLGSFSVFSQGLTENTIKVINDKKANPQLYIHFDKNIYTSNEIIYFTGFLLNISDKDLSKHELLSITVVRNSDSTIVLTDKFIIQEGFVFGSIQVPETLGSDNYQIIAYTNLIHNNFPVVNFAQQIKVIATIDAPIVAGFKLISDKAKMNERKVLLSVLNGKGGFLPKPALVTYQCGKLKLTTKTDITGQLIINLPATEKVQFITAIVKYDIDSIFVKFWIPQNKREQLVKFFPEGGKLIDKMPARVGVEVKNYAGIPLIIKAQLLKDGIPVDTINTSKLGLGLFSFIPAIESKYKIKLLGADFDNQEIPLPTIQTTGVVIATPTSLSKDTISFRLKSIGISNVKLKVHNFRETFVDMPISIVNGQKKVIIPLMDVPKGIVTVTISDTLNNILAEQIFYAHYATAKDVEITSDQPTYKPRQKVTLSLKLRETNSSGVVSIAVVQEKRLSPFYMTDIKSYTYISHELSLDNLSGSDFENKENKELLLLMRGWRNYSWEKQKTNNGIDSLTEEQLKLSVRVTKGKKGPTEAMLSLLGGSLQQIFEVPASGEAILDPLRLLAAPGKYTYLIVVGDKDAHTIAIHDPFNQMNKKVAKAVQYDGLIANTFSEILKNNQTVGIDKGIIGIKEVVISKGTILPHMRNECGDWVCQYKVLNCVNHAYDATSTRPVKGQMYFYNRSTVKFVYPGCEEIRDDARIRAPHKEREFNVDSFENPGEPAIATTIYWNYGILLNNTHAQELSFYTSDIPGKYKIIVQGVGNNDVIFGEHTFIVK